MASKGAAAERAAEQAADLQKLVRRRETLAAQIKTVDSIVPSEVVCKNIVEFVVPRVKADFLFDPVNNPFASAGVREYDIAPYHTIPVAYIDMI